MKLRKFWAVGGARRAPPPKSATGEHGLNPIYDTIPQCSVLFHPAVRALTSNFSLNIFYYRCLEDIFSRVWTESLKVKSESSLSPCRVFSEHSFL